MRALLQRASEGQVVVDGKVIASLSPAPGLVALIGVGPRDTAAEATMIAGKIANLRIFADAEGKTNLSLLDVKGGALVISQFTLYADTRRGRRPGYTTAASPDIAEPLVAQVCTELAALGVPVSTGQFGAHMEVTLTNDGPMTILLDTDEWR
ncbi:MAG TPA: D-aminoacyl-tRNA deacylase [Ktedonobacterales bacterium]